MDAFCGWLAGWLVGFFNIILLVCFMFWLLLFLNSILYCLIYLVCPFFRSDWFLRLFSALPSFFVYSLLFPLSHRQAKHIVLVPKPAIDPGNTSMDPVVLSLLIRQVGTVASVYHKVACMTKDGNFVCVFVLFVSCLVGPFDSFKFSFV
jgi:hypothetical protein